MARVWMRDVAFLLISATALWASGGYVWAARQPQPQTTEVVATPDTWVPFSANVTIFNPKSETVVGRFFRGADGSIRLETGWAGQRPSVVHINNATEQRMYMGRDFGGDLAKFDGWEVAHISRDSFTPPRFRVDNVRWFHHPEKIEDFDLIRWVNPNGTVYLHAPALNGEVLVQQGQRVAAHVERDQTRRPTAGSVPTTTRRCRP